jgi:DNA-binding NarL/FixJ family response regulator
MPKLTDKDYLALALCYAGLSSREIARKLGVSRSRATTRLSVIYRKLELTGGKKRQQAIRWYAKTIGIVPELSAPRVSRWFPSERAQLIMAYRWDGLTDKEIAVRLGVSHHTIINQARHAYGLLHLDTGSPKTAASVWLWQLCKGINDGPRTEAADRRPNPANHSG